MQPGSPTFTLGNQQVDRRLVDAQLIANMAACAQRINAPENPPADTWAVLADRVVHEDAVSTGDLKTLQELGRVCFHYHRELHDRFRESGYQDPAIKAELAEVHVYSDGSDRIREALSFASASTAIAASVGATFGPVGLLTAYQAYAKLSNANLQELIGTLQGVRDGSSPMITRGNEVETVHGHEIWPQMNHMLDRAIESGREGKPLGVTAQYYELTNPQIVGKLAQAAEAGNKVRVNVDAGRLVGFRDDRVEIDAVPDKMRAILQLLQTKGNVAVSVYPVDKLLGDPNDLMHRKGLGVGDEFLVTGMNANKGSGENFDAGLVIKGPGARRFGENFARDCRDSAGASNVDIFGERALAEFMSGDINIGARGLIALFDCMKGPGPAGTTLPTASTYTELEQIAASYGQNLSDYISAPPERVNELFAAGEQVPLTQNGKKQVMALIERTLDATRKPTNMRRLKDVAIASGEASGNRTVTIADQPSEREALMLTAIQNAERYVYIPAFVMTRGIAAMLVARRAELQAEGRDLDVRVIADSGIYPDGGTPNESGVKYLEDNGIPVRWSMLPRAGDHDRKIHAKQILTDKGELCGSTNFSFKGLRDNWEHSAYVEFDPNDRVAVAQQEEARAQFLRLWDHESFELNSLEKGKEKRWSERDSKDYLMQADEARFGIQRDLIAAIETYEKATGAFVSDQAKPLASRVEELQQAGHDPDSATLLAVEEHLGFDGFQTALAALPERQALEDLKRRRR